MDLNFLRVFLLFVNMTNIPSAMADRLAITSFQANLLTAILFVSLFTIPFAFKNMALLGFFIGNLVVFFCASMGWLDSWIVVVQAMLIAGMFSMGFLRRAWRS